VQVNSQNQEKIDKLIHEYIGEQSSYGRCSPDWKKARRQIQEKPELKSELALKLKSMA